MKAAPTVLLLPVALGLVASCAQPTRTQPAATPDGIDEYHVQLPLEDVRAVMQSKLAHAHALLEGMALEDFTQIENNAVQLSALSSDTAWHVHGTSAYEMFSTQFREAVEQMAADARERNLDAVTADYVRMTRTCVTCHSYLRTKGLVPESPIPVSMVPPPLPLPG